ncbi:MAG TPA: HAD-IC family P-type ATPase [Labilithrix sp.]
MRAGQVAILDGAFKYFCTSECKQQFLDVASKRVTLDAMTADPPPVVAETPSPSGVREPHFPDPRSGVSGISPIEERSAIDDGAPGSSGQAPGREAPFDREADLSDPGARSLEPPLADAHEEEAPQTLRSPAVVEEQAPAPSEKTEEARAPFRVRERIASAAPAIGIGAGVLAAILSLAGEGASVVRLPLALVAVAVAMTRGLLRPREPGEPSPFVVVTVVGVAASVAAASRAVADPHADAHASFVGLAAAGALLASILVERARREVEAARARTASLLGQRARVVRGDDIEEMDAAEVKPGAQIVVEAGETVAVDGIVVAGSGEVAPWVESPVVAEKREGDAIVAGATVVSGRLRVTATFTGAERAWLRLASAPASRVEAASPLLALARRSVERGAPIAAIVVAGATYANNGSPTDVLVAACAGAYAVAASAAIVAAGLAHARAHAAAQRRGIVYKDARSFDAAGRADVAVVCSRGTILLGEPEIVAVEAVGSGDVPRMLALAAGAELGSTHPFAAAVLRAARARNVAPEHVRSALKHSGLGVTALAPNGDKVIVGSRAFLLHEKVSVAIADARVNALEAQGRSVLLVAVAGRLVGLLALQDGLRPGARAAVQRLHDARIEPVLLSGEARDTSETIARALDIEHVRPEILPADRGAEVRALGDGGHVVAALGHASSDDGALGAADVSVAMGAAGSAPGEWSCMLASDDVRDAALALTVPRACREEARKAIVAGAAAQVVTALGLAFGLAPPVVAPVIGVVAAAVALALIGPSARNP